MQLVALLMVVGLAVKFWWLIAGVIGLIVAVDWGRRAAYRHAERVEAECRRLAEIAARGDQQHEWVMQGDDRGVFGESPSAIM
jgi:hypothetical protein